LTKIVNTNINGVITQVSLVEVERNGQKQYQNGIFCCFYPSKRKNPASTITTPSPPLRKRLNQVLKVSRNFTRMENNTNTTQTQQISSKLIIAKILTLDQWGDKDHLGFKCP